MKGFSGLVWRGAAVAVLAGLGLGSARPAAAATACGTIVTNVGSVAWTTDNSVVITQVCATCWTTSTAYVTVAGAAFVTAKDWINITTGAKTNPNTGDEIEFAITITNTGAMPLTTLHVTDTVPVGFTYKAGSLNVTPAAGWNTVVAGALLSATQTGSSIAPAGAVYIKFRAYANNVCTPTIVGNTAYVDAIGVCLGNGLWPMPTLTVQPDVVSLSVVKKLIPAAPGIGAPVTYQIIVANVGKATVTTLTVTDTVSPVIVSATLSEPTGFPTPTMANVVAGGTLYSWTGAGLTFAPGAVWTFTVAGTVGPVCAATLVSNTAYIFGSNSCFPTSPLVSSTLMYAPSGTFTVTGPLPGLSVLKKLVPAALTGVGGPATYQIIVTNTGGATVTGLTVVDTISPVIVSATASEPTGFPTPVITNVAPSGTLYAWTGAGLNFLPGTSMTFTITGSIGLVCVPTAISNSAYVAADTACAVSATLMMTNVVGSVIQPPVANLAVSKVQVGNPVNAGDPVKYLIVVSNTGSATLTSLIVSDTVSPIVVGATAFDEPPAVGTPTVTNLAPSGTLFVWSKVGLNFTPGTTWTFTISGNAGGVCAQTAVSNTAFVTGQFACSTTVLSTGPSTVGFILAAPVLSFTTTKIQTLTSGPVVGGALKYLVVVTNTGGVTVTNLTVVDTITPVLMSATAMEPTGFPSPVVTNSAGGTLYVWSSANANFLPATSMTFTVSGAIGLVCAPTAVSNTAFVTGSTVCASQSTYTNNLGFVVQPPVANLTVAKVQVGNPVNAGDPVKYLIVVTNSGNATLTNLWVSDTVSPIVVGATAFDEPPAMGTPTVTNLAPSGTLFVWSGNGLNFTPGTIWTFTISGNAGSVCAQTAVSNTAFVGGTFACSTTVLSTGPSTVGFVLAAPVLSFTVNKIQSPAAGAGVGGALKYLVVVTNTGGVTVTNLTVVDTITPVLVGATAMEPSGFPSPVVTNSAGGTLYVWSSANANFQPTQSMTFTVSGSVGLVCVPTAVSNTAFVAGSTVCGFQNTFTNNVGFVVQPPVLNLAVSKLQTKTPVNVGDPIQYEIVVINQGSATVTNLMVVDTLNPVVQGVTQDASEAAGMAAFGPVTAPSGTVYGWSGAAVNFTPGSNWTFTINGVAGAVCGGVAASNTGFVVGSYACSTTVLNTNVTGFVFGAPILTVSIAKNVVLPNGAGVGELATFQIVVSNTGGATADNLTVWDTVSPVVTGQTPDQPVSMGAPTVTQVASGTLYVWSGSGLNFKPNTTMTFTVTGRIGLVCATAQVSNTAYFVASNTCGQTSGNVVAQKFTVQPPVANLLVSKLQVGNPVNAGDPVKYLIVVSNTGSATLTTLTVTDSVSPTLVNPVTDQPAGYPVPTVSNLAPSGTLYAWSSVAANFTPGTIWTFTISGNAGTVCAQTAASNTAFVMGAYACSTTVMNTNVVGYVLAAPVLSYTTNKIQVPAAGAGIGEAIKYLIVMTNTGGVTVTNVTVSDTLAPAIVGVTTDQPAGFGAPTLTAGRYDWTSAAANFLPATSLTFTVTGSVGLVCAATTVSNTAYTSGSTPCASQVTLTNPVGFRLNPPVTSLAVSKLVTPAGIGGVATYQIVVNNIGSATISTLTVTDTVSPVLTSVSTDQPAAFSAAPIVTQQASGTRFAWSNAAVNFTPGTIWTFTISGTVGVVCNDTGVSNTAFVVGIGPCAASATNMVTNQAGMLVTAPSLGLVVSKKQIPAAGAGVGEALTYQIIVTNTGGATISDLTVIDTISPVLVNVTTDEPAAVGAPSVLGTTYRWDGFAVGFAPATSMTFTITGQVGLVCTPKNVSNTAYLWFDSGCTTTAFLTNPVGYTVQPPVTSLAVLKKQIPASPAVGAGVVYQIIVTNVGTATINNVNVVDTISPVITSVTTDQPAGIGAPSLTQVGGSGSAYAWSGGGMSINPGTTWTFTISGIVGPVCVNTVVSDTAYVGGLSACTSTSMVTNEVDFTLSAPVLSLTLTKKVTTTGNIGDPVAYLLVVANTGGVTVDNLILVDTISPLVINQATDQPAGFGVAVANVAPSGTRYTWAGSVPFLPGTTMSFTVTGNVGFVCLPAAASNTAYTNGWNSCANFSAFSNGNAGFTVVPYTRGMTVVKQQAPASPVIGGPVTYRIVVTNTGNTTITGVTVTDTISPVILFLSTDQPAGIPAAAQTNQISGTRFVWAAPIGLLPQTSWTFTINGTVQPICVSTVVSNTAMAGGVYDCSSTGMITNETDFTLAGAVMSYTMVKQVQTTGNIGDPVTYRLIVTNTGAVNIDNLTVVDTVSPVVINQAVDQPVGWGAPVITNVGAASGTRYVWAGVAIGMTPGTTWTYTITGNVGFVCANTAVSDTAFVALGNSCSTQTALSNPAGFVVAPYTQGVTVNKLQTPASPGVGGPVTYRIVVTNTGNTTITGVIVSDTVSPVLTAQAWDQPLGVPAPAISGVPSGTRYVWSAGATGLFPYTSWTFTVTGTVGLVCVNSVVSNTAIVAGSYPCSSFAMPTVETDFTVPAPILTISARKNQLIGNPGVGESVTYQIVVTNTGGATITTLTVSDTSSPVFTNVVPDQPAGFGAPIVANVAPTGTLYAWSAAGLTFLPGTDLTFTLTGRIGMVCGVTGASDTAFVDGGTSCASVAYGPTNGPMTAGFLVQPPVVALTVVKTQNPASPANPINGDPLGYTIVVTNTGSATIDTLTVTDTVAQTLNVNASVTPPLFVLTNPSAGPSGTVFLWTGAGLAFQPGQSLTFGVSGVVNTSVSISVTNTADVIGRTGVACLATSLTSNPVTYKLNPPALTVSVVKTQAPVSGSTIPSPGWGAPVSYQIVVTNTGGLGNMDSLTLYDTVPAQLGGVNMIVSAAPVGVAAKINISNLGGGVWVASSTAPLGVAPGQGITFLVTGVTGEVCAPFSVTNTAVAYAAGASGPAPTVQSNGQILTINPPAPSIGVTQALTPAAPIPGGPASFRIVVTNTGAATLTNVTLIDTLSPGAILAGVSSPPAPDVFLPLGAGLTPWVSPSGTVILISTPSGTVFGPGASFTVTITGISSQCFSGNVTSVAQAFADRVAACPLVVVPASAAATKTFSLLAPSPSLTVTKDWQNLIGGSPSGSKSPTPGMGSSVRWTVVVTNASAVTAQNVVIMDTLPTDLTTLIGTPSVTAVVQNAPYAWTSSTVLLASGQTVLAWSAPSMAPGESMTYIVDTTINNQVVSANGGFQVCNTAVAKFVNPCDGTTGMTAVIAGGPSANSRCITVAPPIAMTIKIYNAAGELVRSFAPIQVGKAPNDFTFSYTVTGSLCGTFTADNNAPFSPDGDCTNDLVAFTFAQLNGFGEGWDGKNDQGNYVANGSYVVVVESVDAATGNPIVVSKVITVAAKRTQVVTSIFDSAGELIATLPTPGLATAVASVKVTPNPFAPNLSPVVDLANPNNDSGVAQVHLYDSAGNEIDTNPSLPGIQPLLWTGRTCPSEPLRVCGSPTEGTIVNNGVYLVQVVSTDTTGSKQVVTGSVTVSHGELNLLSNLVAAPNPVSTDALENNPAGRVWVSYQVNVAPSSLQVKVYNVAGELVRKFDALDQGPPADPTGQRSAGGSCPTATCGSFGWDGRNASGTVCASGLYVVVVEASDGSGNLQRDIIKIALQKAKP